MPSFEPFPLFFMVVVAFFTVVVARPPLTFVSPGNWLACFFATFADFLDVLLATTESVRSGVCLLVHPFEQIFEVVEPALPEAGHLPCPVDQRSQGAELRAIVRVATFVAVAHQPGLLQDPKMLRDGRLRDPGPGRQAPDRLLS